MIGRLAALTLVGLGIYAVVLRRRQLSWGTTPAEAASPLPGDEVVPAADVVATRAISIDADPVRVWPWLAQMGQGRGGLYSYDWLENLVGCQMASANRVVPEWQSPRPGDEFRLHPDLALSVALVDPPRALVVRGNDGGQTAGGPTVPYDFSWAFTLGPEGGDRTRLLVRERYRCASPGARAMVEAVSLVSFVMTERMLRGIRDRVER